MSSLIRILVFAGLALGKIQAVNIFSDIDFAPRNLIDVSARCQQQYNATDFLTKLQMFDASVKIPVGVGNLNFYHLGDFDECYNAQSKTDMGTIYGQYCLGTLPFQNLASKYKLLVPRALGSDLNSIGFHLAYCIPSGCSTDDLHNMTFGLVYFLEENCQSKATEQDLTSGAIASITVLSLFLGLVVISTTYDVALYYLQKKFHHELLISFSVLTNGRKLISASTNPDQLLCLNGIRAISMMWVLVSHSYSFIMNGPLGSFTSAIELMGDAKNMFIIGASVNVDSFFVVGGLVTVYTFLKAADRGVKFNIFMYYIHRYLRLTPAVAICVLAHATLLDFMGQGPMFNSIHTELVAPCRKYWWSALLYIQNYANDEKFCMPQSWYLSIDFQIFLLSPIVLLPLKWKPKIGLSILGILIVAGVIIPFTIGYVYELEAYLMNLKVAPDKMMEMQSKYYSKTYTRFGPYVIGMLAGYFIYKLKKDGTKIVIHPVLNIFIWAVSVTGIVACVYSYHGHMEYDRLGHSLSLAFLRNAWAVCVCAVVFMCVFGYGGIVNWFLSLPVFQFLTKLSYSMYLTHYALIMMRFASMKYSFELSHSYMLWGFWGDFMFTLGVSLIKT